MTFYYKVYKILLLLNDVAGWLMMGLYHGRWVHLQAEMVHKPFQKQQQESKDYAHTVV